MKTSITIEGQSVKITLAPESELEKLALRDLGDGIGISHTHQSLVLRKRTGPLRSVGDQLDTLEDQAER